MCIFKQFDFISMLMLTQLKNIVTTRSILCTGKVLNIHYINTLFWHSLMETTHGNHGDYEQRENLFDPVIHICSSFCNLETDSCQLYTSVHAAHLWYFIGECKSLYKHLFIIPTKLDSLLIGKDSTRIPNYWFYDLVTSCTLGKVTL